MADDAKEPKKASGALGDLVKAESMLQVALAIPAGVLVGWFIGEVLDKHFHTEWIAVAGVVVGAIAGFTQMFRAMSGYLRRGDQ